MLALSVGNYSETEWLRIAAVGSAPTPHPLSSDNTDCACVCEWACNDITSHERENCRLILTAAPHLARVRPRCSKASSDKYKLSDNYSSGKYNTLI